MRGAGPTVAALRLLQLPRRNSAALPSWLQFAQGDGHRSPGRAHRWRQASEQTHQKREHHPAYQQRRRNAESKSEMRESLPVHSAGGEAVQGKNRNTTNCASDERNQKGLYQEGENNGSTAE